MKLKRGDIFVAAVPGDYGKPRPCVVVQNDIFDELPSISFCPITSTLREDLPVLRLNISPAHENGLREPSQIYIDKISTIHRSRIAKKIGEADEATMTQVTRALAAFLGLG